MVPRLLQILLNIVLFEDSANLWAVSRPLLCLIVLDQAVRTLSLSLIGWSFVAIASN